MLRAALAATTILMLNLSACGIGDKMSDSCFQERQGLDSARNKRLGFESRGIAKHEAAYREASMAERVAARALSDCEIRVSLLH